MHIKNYFKEDTSKKIAITVILVVITVLVVILALNLDILIDSFKNGWNSR